MANDIKLDTATNLLIRRHTFSIAWFNSLVGEADTGESTDDGDEGPQDYDFVPEDYTYSCSFSFDPEDYSYSFDPEEYNFSFSFP